MTTLLKADLAFGKLIGKGHFGEVFLGTDDVHGQVAIKVFRREAGETEHVWNGRKDNLLQEAQHLKKATHRNVVQVYNLLESDSDDAINLVMEFCPRGSLQKDYEAGPFTLRRVRDIATEVTFGLNVLHIRGMLHRDIKPSNILVDANGTAKLADFGLVTDDLILGYGSSTGYSDHLAYEVWGGYGTSQKTDVWALGVTIYRMLHGAPWHQKLPAPKLVVRNGRFGDNLPWLPHIPKKWRRTIRKMLRDDPADRYQNALQVHAALADLPIAPDWACEVDTEEVRWCREEGKRRYKAVWRRLGAGRHEWESWSEVAPILWTGIGER